jgi:hypothetical protein
VDRVLGDTLSPSPEDKCVTTYTILPSDRVHDIFVQYVYGFMAHDIRREIGMGYLGGGGNVLAAMGILAFTEFMGWIIAHTPPITAEKRKWSDADYFDAFYKRFPPCYQSVPNVYREFRSQLLHNYAIERGFDVDMPGLNASCGIYQDVNTKRWHFVVELYFRDFLRTADGLYEELTSRPSAGARKAAGL